MFVFIWVVFYGHQSPPQLVGRFHPSMHRKPLYFETGCLHFDQQLVTEEKKHIEIIYYEIKIYDNASHNIPPVNNTASLPTIPSEGLPTHDLS